MVNNEGMTYNKKLFLLKYFSGMVHCLYGTQPLHNKSFCSGDLLWEQLIFNHQKYNLQFLGSKLNFKTFLDIYMISLLQRNVFVS